MTNKEIFLEQMFANKWLNELTDTEVEHLLDMLATSRGFGYAECQKEYEEKLQNTGFYLLSEVKPPKNGKYEVITSRGRVVKINYETLLGNDIWEAGYELHKINESVVAWRSFL